MANVANDKSGEKYLNILGNYISNLSEDKDRSIETLKVAFSLYKKKNELKNIVHKEGIDVIPTSQVTDRKFEMVNNILKEYGINLGDVFSKDEIDTLLEDYNDFIKICCYFVRFKENGLPIRHLKDFNFNETSLFKSLITPEKGDTIYDPFAYIGALMINAISDYSLFGKINNHLDWAISQIEFDAHCICNANYELGDPIAELKDSRRKYNYIFALPPLDLEGVLNKYDVFKCAIENKLNNGGTIIIALPETFCYVEAQKHIRQFLIENGYLSMVISLPSICSYDNGIDKCVFVAKKEKQEDILFVNGRSYTKEVKNDEFELDVPELIHDIIIRNKVTCKFIEYSKINNSSLDLRPAKYLYQLPEIENPIRLREVIKICHTYETSETSFRYDEFYGMYFSLEFTNNKKWENHKCILSDSNVYICHVVWNELNIALIDKQLPSGCYISLYNGDFAFTLNGIDKSYFEDIIDSKLVKDQIEVLIRGKWAQSQYISVEDFLDITIPLPSIYKQKKIVEEKWERYKLQEQVSNTYSDLAHMLGTPSSKISAALDILAENKDLSPIEQKAIKSIYANLGFMNRLLEMNLNSNIWDSEKEPICLYDFLQTYKENWDFYGAKTFDLEIESAEELKKAAVWANKDALTMLFDCLLDNANRHGFHKQKKAENKVEIYLSNPSKEQLPEGFEQINPSENPTQIILYVRNNGELLPPTFTVEDYSTKGRFSSETGRTGLGGYHVNEIAKSMGGKLTDIFETKDEWEVFEFTIPIHSMKD